MELILRNKHETYKDQNQITNKKKQCRNATPSPTKIIQQHETYILPMPFGHIVFAARLAKTDEHVECITERVDLSMRLLDLYNS